MRSEEETRRAKQDDNMRLDLAGHSNGKKKRALIFIPAG
jgi:hypothetical protein